MRYGIYCPAARQVGAIGIFYAVRLTLHAESRAEAEEKFRAEYETNRNPVIGEVKPTDVGSVIIHPAGTNPYVKTDHPYRLGHFRVKALHEFRDTGKLPDGYAMWDDREKLPITSPEDVEWHQTERV